MRFLLATLFLFLSFQGQAGSAPIQPIDIVFDIDWTTFYPIDPTASNQADNNTIHVEGKSYRATDYLGEVLLALSKHPEVRISFFSGGDQSRNETLLKSVLLPDGRSAYDVAYRVFSKEQLTMISTDSSLKFSERYKKSLGGLLDNATPERTILIDDQVAFALKPWKAVSSLGTFNFQKNFDVSKAGESFFPTSMSAWRAERDKALMWQALLEEAISLSRYSEKSFTQITSELWAAKSERALCKNVFSL